MYVFFSDIGCNCSSVESWKRELLCKKNRSLLKTFSFMNLYVNLLEFDAGTVMFMNSDFLHLNFFCAFGLL